MRRQSGRKDIGNDAQRKRISKMPYHLQSIQKMSSINFSLWRACLGPILCARQEIGSVSSKLRRLSIQRLEPTDRPLFESGLYVRIGTLIEAVPEFHEMTLSECQCQNYLLLCRRNHEAYARLNAGGVRRVGNRRGGQGFCFPVYFQVAQRQFTLRPTCSGIEVGARSNLETLI